jgi:hypothetical protein
MRTTIELRDEHRARLLELAARRGEKGFSNLIAEAVDQYLAQLATGGLARDRALLARGSLAADEAAELSEQALAIRERWR